MCLILFAWRAHSKYPLIVAANRDEFHERPTAPAGFWPDAPELLAGRDLRGGGTWLGVTTGGRFAALTNFREPAAAGPSPRAAPSRGELVTDYLLGDATPGDHAATLGATGSRYDGFNLLLGTLDSLYCVSNREAGAVAVSPGVHALSNHLLDTDWPKACFGRDALRALVDGPDEPTLDALLALLDHREPVGGGEPRTWTPEQVPELVTRLVFIASGRYGTRSSTALLVDEHGRAQFAERPFGPGGAPGSTRRHEFAFAPRPGA